MRDRQIFETFKLANGITSYYYPANTPFSQFRIIVPVGHTHNVPPYLPGTAHALEHLIIKRSKKYPKIDQFEQLIELRGGAIHASTGFDYSEYGVDVPANLSVEAWHGLLSHVFEPRLRGKDLSIERGAIASERESKKHWFPSSNEMGQYLYTKWMFDIPFSLRQRLGTDEDLALMTPQNLEEFHKNYLTKNVRILVGGNVDIQDINTAASVFQLSLPAPPQMYEPRAWKEREYHEKAFDTNEWTLLAGNFKNETPDYKTCAAIYFIGRFLVNSTQGILYRWLRKEKGWVYGVHFNFSADVRGVSWIIDLSFKHPRHLTTVRRELWPRMEAGIRDKALVEKEIERRLGLEVFDYQTVESILAGAAVDLTTFGKIYSEQEYREFLNSFRDIDYLDRIFLEYFNPETSGQFCARPKKIM